MSEAASFNTVLSEPLIEACSRGRFKDVVSLLDAGADPNSAIEEMGRNGLRKVYPISATFRVLARGDALPRLALRQSERIIQALVNSGARLRLVEREVLLHSVRMGMPDMISKLVEHGARVQRYAHELMEMAILQNKLDCANRLKALGVEPNVRDQWGSTTFLDLCSGKLGWGLAASSTSQADSVDRLRERLRALFELGVDMNITDKVGATALMRSIVEGQDAAMRALLEEGASLEPAMCNGVNALHLAAGSGSLERLKLILKHVTDRGQIERIRVLRLQPDVKAHLTQTLHEHWENQAESA